MIQQVGSQYNLYGQSAVYNSRPPQKQISFGDRSLFSQEDISTDTAKDAGVVLTLGYLASQFLKKCTNSYLISYLDKHKNIAPKEILDTSAKMLKEKGLLNKIKIYILDDKKEAYYTHKGNYIKIHKDKLLALPHEIGHGIVENKTTVLKYLQRFRGRYAAIALALYALGRSKPDNPFSEEEQSTFAKMQNFLHKYRILIPMIAFSPELITEFAASKYGLDGLKKYASPALQKAARKHYIAAFCTYLAFPVFAMLDNLTLNKKSAQYSTGFG